MLLQLQNISYSIQTRDLINDLSLCIHENEVVSVIGHNGSGKSTLLKILLGTINPTKGTLQKKSGLSIGYVPQKIGFTDQLPLTVNDFIQIYNQNDTQTNDLSCSLLSVDDLLDIPLSGLSGGQRQKVLIYNALLGNPDILLLDEPTAGLDFLAQREFYSLLEHINTEHNVSIVLVSHDTHSGYTDADKIVYLYQGVSLCGSVDDEDFLEKIRIHYGGHLPPYLFNSRDDG